MMAILRICRALVVGSAGLALLASAGARGQQDSTAVDEARAIPHPSSRPEDDSTRGIDLRPGIIAVGIGSDALGLTLTPIEPALQAQLDLSEEEGLIVQEVAPDSPASTAGLKKNDLVLTIDNRPVRSVDD